jgi:hypothetical protein
MSTDKLFIARRKYHHYRSLVFIHRRVEIWQPALGSRELSHSLLGLKGARGRRGMKRMSWRTRWFHLDLVHSDVSEAY